MPQHFATIQRGRYVERIVWDCLGQKIAQAERFALGLSHYVFDVVTRDGGVYVIRIARPARKAELERGLYWQARLEALDVPLPRLYHRGELEGYAFAVYQRLPGADLEQVYPTLSTGARKRVAQAVADIQRKIQALDDPALADAPNWPDRLRLILERSRREILAGGLFDQRYVSLAREKLDAYQDYLESVRPRAFLYDASVRNVIVHQGWVSGIVDVDDLWLGDPLLAVGRAKTLLLLMRQPTDYVSFWCQHWRLSAFQIQVVNLYALLYGVRFMGTLGQELNGNPSVQTDSGNVELLKSVTQELLKS